MVTMPLLFWTPPSHAGKNLFEIIRHLGGVNTSMVFKPRIESDY